MCGFCGYTGSTSNNEIVLNSMMHKIIHRGPDSSGVHQDDNISIGFRRLSIIDIQDGHQPIYNEDKSIVVVLNGEIYNYISLKQDLISNGHTFYTNSDTEVLVHLYEEYNTDMLNYIRGMFAFVIYDIKKEQVFAARDPFGIKPFYYTLLNDSLVFSSEIKAILEYPDFKKEVNLTALENYLTFQYSVLEETFFKSVYKLMPGNYLIFKNNDLKIIKYFEAKFENNSKNTDDLETTSKKIHDTVLESLNLHKTSDVEIGCFLSSGVDSSYIASCFGGDKTFSVGFFNENYNEISYAENLSNTINATNYNKIISSDEYFDSLESVQYFMDEPLADPSAVGLFFLSKLASTKVKVCLSGEGADEFFGGYNIYKEPLDLKIITWLPIFIRKLLGNFFKLIPFEFKGKNFFIRAGQSLQERFIGNAKIFTKKEREKILLNPTFKYPQTEITKNIYENSSFLDDITKMQLIDLNFWLVGDILLKADKMSMANSLEVRVPFLDKEVFKVASKIPTKQKVSKKETKIAFRHAASKNLDPDVAKKKKLGFPVPIRVWLKEDKYYNIIKIAFSSKISQKYFNVDSIISLLDDHRNSKKDNSRKIWTIYTFLVWHKQFFG